MDQVRKKTEEIRQVESRYIHLHALGVKAIDPKLVWDVLPNDLKDRVRVQDFNEIMATVMGFHVLAAMDEVNRDIDRYEGYLDRVLEGK